MENVMQEKVAIFACISTIVKGQFFRTLESLEKKYKNIIYVLPKDADNDGFMTTWKKEHKVYFVQNQLYKTFLKGNIKIPTKAGINEILDILKKEDVKIVHSHFDFYDKIIAKIATKMKLKVFYHFHNPFLDYYDTFSGIKRKILYAIFRYDYYKMLKVGKLLVVGKGYYNRLNEKELPKAKNQIYLMENAVDFNYIIPRQEFSDKIEKFLLIGNRPMKGVDFLCSVADELLKRGITKFEFQIVTTEETENVVKSHYNGQIPSQIKCLGYVADMNEVFKKTDCFVSASSRENHCYGILEALAYGLPCLVSDIYTNRWAEASGNAEFFQLNNVCEFANLVEKYLNSDYDIQKAKDAIEFMKANYNMDSWTDKMIEFYKA